MLISQYLEEIQKIVPTPLTRDELRSLIPEKLHVNLDIIQNKCIYRPRNKYRVFECLNLSIVLSNETEIQKILHSLMDIIEIPHLIYVDFDAIYQTSDTNRPFKFEFGSKNTRLNNTFKIVDSHTAELFLNEFKMTFPELQNKQFLRHQSVLDFASSGFRPYKIISMKIYIQSL